MRFYKKRIEAKPGDTIELKFAWLPIKIYGQYLKGYGQNGYILFEFYWQHTTPEGGKYYSLT